MQLITISILANGTDYHPPTTLMTIALSIISTLFLQKTEMGCLSIASIRGIEAKVHYPVPIYRQPALEHLGHKEGDFPIADEHTKKIITFPCDQHLSAGEMDFVIETVKNYYA